MEAAPATGDSVTQSDGHVVHPGVDDRLPGSSDSKAMRIALLVSKQEELYGKNMYETLTPEDEPELRYLRHHLRMDVDDAILKIYERKGFVVPEIPEAEAIEGAAASSSDSAAGGKGHGPDDGAVATEKDDKKKAKSKVCRLALLSLMHRGTATC